jgi:death-on-curing family protein
MKKLSIENIITLHNYIIEKSGGTKGIRDINLVDSAINAPFQTFSGRELYPTFEEKATRLAFGLTMNHAFVDGNKRIGAMALISFLEMNGYLLLCDDIELANTFLDLASEKIDYDMLFDWVKKHITYKV